MSEASENRQKVPAQNAESQGKSGGGRHRHHRHHRGGKGKGHTKNENHPNAAGAAEQQKNAQPNKGQGQKAPQKKQETAKPQQNQGKQQQQNQQQGNHPASGNAKKRGRRGGRGHHGRESRPFDPYEKPSREEIELSELRAQIVMKAADGTVPTAFGAAPAPKKEEREIEVDQATVDALLDGKPLPTDEEGKKVEVVGIRFRSAGKTYYFSPNGIQVKKGDSAIVETTRGPEFGDVCIGNTMVSERDVVSPLRPLIRIATRADIEKNAANREREQDAIAIFQEKVAAHKLEMKAIDVQYAFDGSKILFYFSSEGRVDFRELVKDLASVFHTRIELRQIGIRDEAKMLGGIGACGRMLCCSTFLPDFVQVSIKMAKDQNLSLNSSKISGVCGRLMCCLRYEADTYAEEIKKTPAHDALVRTEDGIGHVISSNPLAGTVRVVLQDSPDTAPKQYHRDQVTVLPKERKHSGDGKEQKK